METKIIQISAGKSPKECDWVVTQLRKVLMKEIEKAGFKILTEKSNFDENSKLFKSVELKISGVRLNQFCKNWQGTIKWIGNSMLRKNCKRKNWFVKISIDDVSTKNDFDNVDLQFQTMRSSGNGGQNVNKLETAVRVIDKNSGIVVLSKSQRSQHQNKKNAIELLKQKIEKVNENNALKEEQKLWQNHNEIERGNPVKIFKGLKFKEVK